MGGGGGGRQRTEAGAMNGVFKMQGGKNCFLPKEMNANRFFWDSHWLEIWSNHFYPSMGPNGGSVATDSECEGVRAKFQGRESTGRQQEIKRRRACRGTFSQLLRGVASCSLDGYKN
jgi:hypothetical protein